MDKNEIIKQLIAIKQSELTQAKEVYEGTHNLVKQGDLKSDGKYDTRATEANYLAGGQRQRLNDLEQELGLLEELQETVKNKFSSVTIGSLADIEFNAIEKTYFISPISGGNILNIDGEVVMVVSAFSPIGSGAINLTADESFDIEVKNETREYFIKKVY